MDARLDFFPGQRDQGAVRGDGENVSRFLSRGVQVRRAIWESVRGLM